MQALEAERLKRYEKILEMKKQIEEEEKNVIEIDEELTHKEPKEKLYENDVLRWSTLLLMNYNPSLLKN
jgi:hypothetical protein